MSTRDSPNHLLAPTSVSGDTALVSLRRYLRHPGLATGTCLLIFLLVVALLAPWLAPHPPLKTNKIGRAHV